jgi:hypothetical protein
MFSLLFLFILIYVIAGILDRHVFATELFHWRKNIIELSHLLEQGSHQKMTTKFNEICCELFDYIYDKDHFSEKRLIRSIVSTLMGIIIFTFLVGYEEITGVFMVYFVDVHSFSYVMIIGLISIIAPIFFNIIPDYFSLMESRVVLTWANNKGSFVVILLIILDLIATSIIFTIGFYFFAIVCSLMLRMDGAFASVLHMNKFNPFSLSVYWNFLQTGVGKVFLLTTFLTSFFWIFFVCAYFIIRIFYRFSSFAKYFFREIGESNKPVTILATGLNTFILICYLIASYVW